MKKKEKKPLSRSEKLILLVLFAFFAILVGCCLTDGIAQQIFRWLFLLLMEGALLFTALTILLFCISAILSAHRRSRYTYPAEAVVTGCDHHTRSRTLRNGQTETSTVYRPQLRYEYRGNTYCSALEGMNSRDEARKEYPVGSKKTIYLIPKDPQRISASRGFGPLSLLIQIPKLLIALFLIACLVIGMVCIPSGIL